MGSPSIDYMALAKQAGAVSSTPAPKKIDYNALAKQAGAVSSTPAPAPVTPGGIDPSQVAGAGPLGLPGMPAPPNPIDNPGQNFVYRDNKGHVKPVTGANQNAAYLHYALGNTPLHDPGTTAAQTVNAAGRDIGGGVANLVQRGKDWLHAPAADEFLSFADAPFLAANGAVEQIYGSGKRFLVGGPNTQGLAPDPVGGVAQFLGGDPDTARAMQNQGDQGSYMWHMFAKPAANAVAMEAAGQSMRAVHSKLVPIEGTRSTNAFANLIAGGVKSGTPQETAVVARPVWQDAAKQLGLKDEGTIDKVWTGDTPSRNLPGQEGPLRKTFLGTKKILDVADKAVDIADKPMAAVMRVASQDVVDANVRNGIVDGLEQRAKAASSVGNEPTAKAYLQLAEKVKQQRTYGDLDALKKNANHQMERMGAPGSISQQMAQATTPIAAWQDLGGLIRENMYPVLQDRYIPKPGQQGWFDLAGMGRREAAVLDARDGAYKAHDMAARQDAAEGAMTAKEKATEGSMYKTHIARRLLGVNPTPAGQVNKMFRRGLGELGGPGVPETVTTVPVKQPLALPPPPGSNIVPTPPSGPVVVSQPLAAPGARPWQRGANPASVAANQQRVGARFTPAPPGYSEAFPLPTMPAQEGIPGPAAPMAQSYRGTVQVPNPDHTPLAGPSHFQQQQELGSTAGTIPDRTRGAQTPARVRADQLGVGHQPPAESGIPANNPRGLNPPSRSLTGPETLTKANFEQHFGTNAAPAVDRGTAGMLRTNDPAVATRALNAMDQYMRTDEFKALDAQARYTAKQQAADLRRQLVQHAAVGNMPGPAQYQVHWTPANLGKKAGRKVGKLRRGAAYTALVPPGKKKDQAEDDETTAQEEERMRAPAPAD